MHIGAFQSTFPGIIQQKVGASGYGNDNNVKHGEIFLSKHCPYVRTTYGPPVVGKHREAFLRSSLCGLPPLALASPRPRRGCTQKSPPFRDIKKIRSSVPHHLVGSDDCHRVYPQRLYLGLGMGQYVLLQKHLGKIPSIVFIPDNNSLAWNWPRRGHLRHLTIFQLRRTVQPVPASLFRDWCLPLIPLPSN